MGSLRWQLEQGVAQCDAVFLMWSVAASRSEFVRQELCSALAMVKNVVPVLLEDTELPNWLISPVSRGVVTPLRVEAKALSSLLASPVEGLLNRVRRANASVEALTDAVEGVEFELVSLSGGLLADFAIGKYPITQAQWTAVMGNNPSTHVGDVTRPVETVSWNDAQDFLHRLNDSCEHVYRLPNEAEWEFSCRAGNLGNWCFGDNEGQLQEFAWYMDNTSIGSERDGVTLGASSLSKSLVEMSPYKTNTVLSKRPNDWGIFHMHGNVSEWCEDNVISNPAFKRIRGGAYNNGPRSLRCAARGEFRASLADSDTGLRICRTTSAQ